jgi:hypothetical protein
MLFRFKLLCEMNCLAIGGYFRRCMNFTFDFSSVDWIALKSLGITMKEVMSVFGIRSSVTDSVNGIDILSDFLIKESLLL